MVLSFKRKIPTLVELCIQTAIDNIRYIGDVGETDIYLLKDILPHCTADQLMHIEKSTQGRDLSLVTDSLWKKFYEKQFGQESADLVVKRMKQKKVVFKWSLLYEAKLKEREEAQNKSLDRLKKLYEEEGARKQSRQVRLCSKIPPSCKKRNFEGTGPGSNFSNTKSNLMKKAKMEYLNSHEARIHEAMKKRDLKGKSFPPSSIPRTTKPSGFLGRTSASCSKLNKP